MRKTNTPPPVRLIRKSVTAITSAILLGMGLAAAPANADTTTNDLPDHIVNGDFEYPKGLLPHSVNKTFLQQFAQPSAYPEWEAAWGGNFTYITRYDGTYFDQSNCPMAGLTYGTPCWKTISGFDASKFAWDSSQTTDTTGPEHKKGAVEIQQDSQTGNIYAEIVAVQPGRSIYQDIATIPGAVYTVSLKHASLNDSNIDKLSVMIGAPGKEQPVEMTRETTNGNGDKIGETSTVIATKVSNTYDGNRDNDRKHSGQWETYTGAYTIPAGQTVTRFTFKSVGSADTNHGNLVDDIRFEISYPLHYDLKGGTGTAPQQHN